VKKIELLSPAGSRGALEAAIAYGADAVYLGGKDFGARQLAENFDDSQMRAAIRYAHLRDTKVYVTVNTLASANLPRMLAHVGDLYHWGADAVIVQDIGLALLVREHFPEMPVHASTQMTIHNRGQTEWADDLGFSAVVVSREVPLASIGPMFKGLRARPEIFVHGALCYSFSGQCTFSHIRQERSANRGACAQPCRRTYKVVLERDGRKETVQARGRYPLSMRDLCVIGRMDEIVDSGVALIKIEGRMKKPEYVGVTTSIYRKYLDAALAGTFDGVEKRDLDRLWLAYNRDFTSGYLFGERFGQVKGRLRPDNRGLLLGDITRLDLKKERMTIAPETGITPNAGDVIRIVSDHDFRIKNLTMKVESIAVGKNGWTVNSHREAEAGDQAYLITHDVLPTLAEVQRGIPISVKVIIQKGSPIEMLAVGPGFEVRTKGTEPVTPAKTSPMDKAAVERQVRKTGTHCVTINEINIELAGGCFVPVSELNAVRRRLFDLAEKRWLQLRFPPRKRAASPLPKADLLWPSKPKRGQAKKVELAVITERVEELPMLRKEGVGRIYLDALYGMGKKHAASSILKKLDGALGKLVYLKTPRITFGPALKELETIVTKLKGKELGGYRVGNMGALKTVRKADPDARLVAASSFNVTNPVSARYLLEKVEKVTLSIELTDDERARLAAGVKQPGRLEVLAGGRPPLLITNDCLLGSTVDDASTGPGGFHDKSCAAACEKGFWYLKDEKKRHTPLWMDGDCRGHLYNHKPLDVDVDAAKRAGIGSFVLDLRGYPVGERPGVLREMKERLGLD